jgi:hypothetical protein
MVPQAASKQRTMTSYATTKYDDDKATTSGLKAKPKTWARQHRHSAEATPIRRPDSRGTPAGAPLTSWKQGP